MFRRCNLAFAGLSSQFDSSTLEGGTATFGGQTMPLCNYQSALARKFVYVDNKVYKPHRRHIFRMKVRTAAEIRLHELVKKYMGRKMTGGYGRYGLQMTNNLDFDNASWVIPKDQYEVKKLTAYMTSRKMSEDYKKKMNDLWTQFEFICHSTQLVGKMENIGMQNARAATDEEFMAFTWYVVAASMVSGVIFSSLYWWWKYGQQPTYVELK